MNNVLLLVGSLLAGYFVTGGMAADTPVGTNSSTRSNVTSKSPDLYVKELVDLQAIIDEEPNRSIIPSTSAHQHTPERRKMLKSLRKIRELETILRAEKELAQVHEELFHSETQENLKQTEQKRKEIEGCVARAGMTYARIVEEREEELRHHKMEEIYYEEKLERYKEEKIEQDELSQLMKERATWVERLFREQEETNFFTYISGWLVGWKTDTFFSNPRAANLISALTVNIHDLFEENLSSGNLASYRSIKEKMTNIPDVSDLFRLTISYCAHRESYHKSGTELQYYWAKTARKMGDSSSGALNLVKKCHDFLTKTAQQEPTQRDFKTGVEDMFYAILRGDSPLGLRKRPATKDELAILIPALRASGKRIFNTVKNDILTTLKALAQRYIRENYSENQLFNHQVACFFIAIGGLNNGRVEDAQIQEALQDTIGRQFPVCQILSKRQHYNNLLEKYDS